LTCRPEGVTSTDRHPPADHCAAMIRRLDEGFHEHNQQFEYDDEMEGRPSSGCSGSTS
jgi:hypothetical protein